MRFRYWCIRRNLLILGMVGLCWGYCEKGTAQGHSKACLAHIFNHEKMQGIPSGLLHAIAKAESGKKDVTGQILPWPWTINAQGKGYYFPTKETAIAAVQKLLQAGVKSIDVGCMQVNLHHHPAAFKSLNDAFDPGQNVAYAARFLKGLEREFSSWKKAVAYYHSANPHYHEPYQKNVLALWYKDKEHRGELRAATLGGPYFHSSATSPRVYRLKKLKTLKLGGGQGAVLQTSSPRERRITRDESPHITRLTRPMVKRLKTRS